MKKISIVLMITSLVLNAAIVTGFVVSGMNGTVITTDKDIDIACSISERFATDSMNAKFDSLSAYQLHVDLYCDTTNVLSNTKVVLCESSEVAQVELQELIDELLHTGLVQDSIVTDLVQIEVERAN